MSDTASDGMEDIWEESVRDTISEIEDFWEEPEEYTNEIEDFFDEIGRDTSDLEEFCEEMGRETSEIEEFYEEPERDISEREDGELARNSSEIEEFCVGSMKNIGEIDTFCDEPEDNSQIKEEFCEITDYDLASEILRNITENCDRNEREAREKMPKVIAITKKKLLIAINKIPDKKLSGEDEKFMKSFRSKTLFTFAIRKSFEHQSIVWDDTKSNRKVQEILKKHAKYELSKYLECAKIVFLAYSGKMERTKEGKDAMEYVLTHARQFGDTTKNVFQIDNVLEQKSEAGCVSDKLDLPQLPTNKVLNKIDQLIQDLTTTYDETKFAILNVNTTYFTLLMLRRIVKNEAEFSNAFKKIQTHDNYVKLCPSPLGNQLPECGLKIGKQDLVDCAYLAIEAYLNTKDEKTKRILRATSVLYMEWNGLQLSHLFFKVVDLYKIKAEELYDSLFDVNSEYPVLMTCFNLADNYYDIYEKLKTGETNLWFPYCRVLDGAYHVRLSAKENVQICIILAYLVDLKIGFDKSTIRMSHWVKSNFSEECVHTAKTLYKKLNKNV